MSKLDNMDIDFTKAMIVDGKKLTVGKKAESNENSFSVISLSYKNPQERAETEIDTLLLFKKEAIVFDLDGTSSRYDKKGTRELLHALDIPISELIKCSIKNSVEKFGLEISPKSLSSIFEEKPGLNLKSLSERMKNIVAEVSAPVLEQENKVKNDSSRKQKMK